jgi:hypothetical protein
VTKVHYETLVGHLPLSRFGCTSITLQKITLPYLSASDILCFFFFFLVEEYDGKCEMFVLSVVVVVVVHLDNLYASNVIIAVTG